MTEYDREQIERRLHNMRPGDREAYREVTPEVFNHIAAVINGLKTKGRSYEIRKVTTSTSTYIISRLRDGFWEIPKR